MFDSIYKEFCVVFVCCLTSVVTIYFLKNNKNEMHFCYICTRNTVWICKNNHAMTIKFAIFQNSDFLFTRRDCIDQVIISARYCLTDL